LNLSGVRIDEISKKIARDATYNIMKEWDLLKFPEAYSREINLAYTLQQNIYQKHHICSKEKCFL